MITESTNWKYDPWKVGLCVVLFFPYGLYLPWKHPSWSTKTKAIATACWLVALLIGMSNESKERASLKNQTQAVSIQRQEQLFPNAPTKPVKSPSPVIGDEFQLGDYRYKILSVEKRSRIGQEIFGEFAGETASSGASFVIVTYSIENCTKSSQTVLADDFKLIDAKGRTFDTSSKVSTALLMHSEDKDFLLSELQPGLPRNMQQGFELPNDSLESELTLVIPKKGFWSTGEVKMNVRMN